MTPARSEDGYSMVEVLISLLIFSVVSIGFTSVMMSSARSTDVTRRNVRLSEEARLGLNRIARDVREAGWIALPGNVADTAYTSFTVRTDYDGNGAYANSTGPNGTAESNYEVITYAYDAAAKRITATADGFPTETLIKGVEPTTSPVFSFTSNRLEYDWNSDGVSTMLEVSQNACAQGGYNLTLDTACNNTLTDKELAYLTNFALAVNVTSGTSKSEFFAEAQLRNRR